MKSYIVRVNFEREVEAEDEDKALENVFDDLALSNDSIENYIEVEPITMNYQFGVKATEKHDEEVAEIEAESLEEAKKKFAEQFPEDVDNITVITSDNGYEEIL